MRTPRTRPRRRAAAATELALLLPVVILLFVIACDFCRVFHYYTVVTNCARAAAVHESDEFSQVSRAYGSAEEAARADWPPGLGDAPTVTSTPVTDGGIDYKDVRVRCTFHMALSYGGLPATVNLSRTVRVRVAKQIPNF